MFSRSRSLGQGTIVEFVEQAVVPLASEYLKLMQIKEQTKAQIELAKKAAAGYLPGAVTVPTAAPTVLPSAAPDYTKWILLGGAGLVAVLLITRKK